MKREDEMGWDFIIILFVIFVFGCGLSSLTKEEKPLPIQPKLTINERLEVEFTNDYILLKALELDPSKVYLTNISESWKGKLIQWTIWLFTNRQNISGNYRLSPSGNLHPRFYTIQLWTNPSWELGCVGLWEGDEDLRVQLDEIILIK